MACVSRSMVCFHWSQRAAEAEAYLCLTEQSFKTENILRSIARQRGYEEDSVVISYTQEDD